MKDIQLALLIIALGAGILWAFWPIALLDCPPAPNLQFRKYGDSYSPETFNNTKIDIDPMQTWDRNDHGNQPS